MRYITGSRMFRLGEAMSIFARKVRDAVGELAGPHPLEQVKVLVDRAIAVGAVRARLGERAAGFADLVGREVADVGLAGLDQLHGPLVNLLEIVRGVKQPVLPIEAQPADVLHDRIDVLDVLFAGVGIVEAEVAQAAELLGDAEVQADRLGVADVQVAVGLGRKAGIAPARRACRVRLSSRMISRMKSVETFGVELSVVMVLFRGRAVGRTLIVRDPFLWPRDCEAFLPRRWSSFI